MRTCRLLPRRQAFAPMSPVTVTEVLSTVGGDARPAAVRAFWLCQLFACIPVPVANSRSATSRATSLNACVGSLSSSFLALPAFWEGEHDYLFPWPTPALPPPQRLAAASQRALAATAKCLRYDVYVDVVTSYTEEKFDHAFFFCADVQSETLCPMPRRSSTLIRRCSCAESLWASLVLCATKCCKFEFDKTEEGWVRAWVRGCVGWVDGWVGGWMWNG